MLEVLRDSAVFKHCSDDTTFSLGSELELKWAVIKSTAALKDFSMSKGGKSKSETE